MKATQSWKDDPAAIRRLMELARLRQEAIERAILVAGEESGLILDSEKFEAAQNDEQEAVREAAAILSRDLREALLVENSLYGTQGTPRWNTLAELFGWRNLGDWYALSSLFSLAVEELRPGHIERGAASALRTLDRLDQKGPQRNPENPRYATYAGRRGRSLGAIDAEDRGLLPLTRAIRPLAQALNITQKEARRRLLEAGPSEWHHTGNRARRTDYYDWRALVPGGRERWEAEREAEARRREEEEQRGREKIKRFWREFFATERGQRVKIALERAQAEVDAAFAKDRELETALRSAQREGPPDAIRRAYAAWRTWLDSQERKKIFGDLRNARKAYLDAWTSDPFWKLQKSNPGKTTGQISPRKGRSGTKRRASTKKKAIREARKLAAAFHGKKRAKITRVRLPSLPSALVYIGTLERLDYLSDKEGEATVYEHETRLGAAVYADPDGRMILVVPPGRKRFRISARGLLN